MLEKIKTKVQENPEQAKKIGIAVGALVGVTVAGTIIFLNRDGFEIPWVSEDIQVELPKTE